MTPFFTNEINVYFYFYNIIAFINSKFPGLCKVENILTVARASLTDKLTKFPRPVFHSKATSSLEKSKEYRLLVRSYPIIFQKRRRKEDIQVTTCWSVVLAI